MRCKLIPSFYELRDKKAYKRDSAFYNNWLEFIEKWYDNGNDQFRKGCTSTPFVKKDKKQLTNNNEVEPQTTN